MVMSHWHRFVWPTLYSNHSSQKSQLPLVCVGYNRRGVGRGGSRVSGCSPDFWGAGAVLGKPNSLSATRNVMKRFAAKRLNRMGLFSARFPPCPHCVTFWIRSPQQGDQGPQYITQNGQHQCFWCIATKLLWRRLSAAAYGCALCC